LVAATRPGASDGDAALCGNSRVSDLYLLHHLQWRTVVRRLWRRSAARERRRAVQWNPLCASEAEATNQQALHQTTLPSKI
jgi:hypothetical protein